MNKKLLVILGPTTTGKTDLALRLAKIFNGELVSCDSRQVYIGLDLGTGKLPSLSAGKDSKKLKLKKQKQFWEIDGVKVWMYDVIDPKKQYTVANYIKQANRVIKDITKRCKLPIIVGGTGFYLKALLEGLTNLDIPINLRLRKQLNGLPLDELQNNLQSVSVTRWNQLNQSDQKNRRRLTRSIELALMYPYRKKTQNSLSRQSFWRRSEKCKHQDWDILKIGLTAQRQKLYSKVDSHLSSRLAQGLVEEANKLWRAGLALERMKQLGLEYGVLAQYLSGEIDKQELINKLKTKIHQYTKRQLTWFKKEKDVQWFDITDKTYLSSIAKLSFKWYHSFDDSQG